eukprot:c23579_g1_i1 orf=429-662(-)
MAEKIDQQNNIHSKYPIIRQKESEPTNNQTRWEEKIEQAQTLPHIYHLHHKRQCITLSRTHITTFIKKFLKHNPCSF